MSQVNTELGLSSTAQRSLGESTTRTLFGIPSGQISMSDGHGKANASASISDQLIYDFTVLPGYVEVRYRLHSDGNAATYTGGSYSNIGGEWLTAGSNSDFEVRASVVSGSCIGTTGTWLAMTSTNEWAVGQGSSGLETCTLTIEIRRVSDSVVVDTATITLSAEASA